MTAQAGTTSHLRDIPRGVWVLGFDISSETIHALLPNIDLPVLDAIAGLFIDLMEADFLSLAARGK